MPEAFDPYYIWLGIPPEEQPPHYYRLLGLRVFETNIEAIGHAADQRMTLLRTFQTGKHTADSQRLLNEVALARVTLLNADKKAAYDQQLQAWLSTVAPPPPAPPAAPSGSGVAEAWPLEIDRPPRRLRSRRRLPVFAATAILALLAAAGAIFWAESRRPADQGPQVANNTLGGENGENLPPSSVSTPLQNGPNTSPASRPAPADVTGPSVAATSAGDKLDGPIDLLARVVPEKDAVRGNWRTEDGQLVAAIGTNLLQIPFAPPEEYDLIIRAERTAGQSGIYLGLVAGGKHFLMLLDGYLTSGGLAGIELLDGELALRSSAQRQGLFLPRQGPFTLTYRIRKNGFTVERDGAAIFAWQGDYSRCSTREIWAVPNPRQLAIAVSGAEYRFTQLAIHPASGPIDFGQLVLAPPLTAAELAGPSEAASPDMPPVSPGELAQETAPADPPEEAIAARHPLPDAARQEQIAAQLRDVVNLEEARSAEEKSAAVTKLLELAEGAGNRPDERFILWREAVRLATAAGNAAQAVEVTDRIAADFEVDAVQARLTVLKNLVATARDEAQIAALVTAADTVIDDALDAEQYDTAAEAAAAAYRACQRPAGQALRKQVHERQKWVEKVHADWQNVQKSVAALAAAPDDPAANLEAGRWYALALANWEKGLPYLAKGGDDALAQAARQELAAEPADAEAEAALGDLWWDLARSRQGDERAAILAHAGSWYDKAAPSLPSGLVQTKVSKRLEEIAASDKSGRGSASGNVLPGRWIDILRFTDIARDSVVGRWMPSPIGLAVASGPQSRLMLPVQIEGSYDLEIHFTRTAGDDIFGAIIPVGSYPCFVFLSAGSGRFRGIELIDGRTGDANPATQRPGRVVDRRRHTLLVRVRTDSTNARIEALFNGQQSISWAGPVASLSLPPGWSLPQADRPGVAAHQSTMVFHAVRLRLISGKAKLLKHEGGTAKSP